MRVGDKIAPLHHPIFKPANLPDFLAVARNPRPRTQHRRPRPSLPGPHRPALERSCRPRPHPRSRFTETTPYLPSRGPQTQRAAHPGQRQTLSLQVPRAQKKTGARNGSKAIIEPTERKIGAYAVGSISSRLPKDAGGNILPTGPPFLGRRSPIMTRRRSTFLAGQPADPDELQVEFERRNAPLPDRLIGEFIPISAAGFVCVWSLFARAGSRIVAVRHNKPPL